MRIHPADTVDHVPPKGIFREPRPSDLITVPACEHCNRSFRADDDYFLNLALDWEASESSHGKEVVEKRLRAMKRKESRYTWKDFFGRTKPVEVYSPGGVYLGDSLAFSLNEARLIKTVNRIIRGLYFNESKKPLPLMVDARSMLFSQYVEQNRDDPKAMEFVRYIPRLDGRVIGKDAFEFRYSILDEQRFVSFWYLEFFQRFAFVGFTGEAETPTGSSDIDGQPA